jgi:hypothetical protein
LKINFFLFFFFSFLFTIQSSGLLKSPELGTPDSGVRTSELRILTFQKSVFQMSQNDSKTLAFGREECAEILAHTPPRRNDFWKSHFSVGVLEARISTDCFPQNICFASHFGTFEKRTFEKSRSGVPSSGLFRSPELRTPKKGKC